MSRSGAPQARVENATGLRVGVATARWHQDITDGLLAGTIRALTEAGVPDPTTVTVPGVFELAVTAKALTADHDAVIALGTVIRGDTPHFDYVCQSAALGLTTVAVSTGVPVGFGILTCANKAQALARCGGPDSTEDKGYEAATAALTTATALRSIHPPVPEDPIGSLLAAGDVQAIATIIGHPYRVSGLVIPGDGRGRTLGFPTANITTPPTAVLPTDGVYAGWLLNGTQRMPVAISLGTNPTFPTTGRRLEAHVIDHPDLHLYGQRIDLEFGRRLRDMQRFLSTEELTAQITADINHARTAATTRVHPAKSRTSDEQSAGT